jgi:hypothetical protein
MARTASSAVRTLTNKEGPEPEFLGTAGVGKGAIIENFSSRAVGSHDLFEIVQ